MLLWNRQVWLWSMPPPLETSAISGTPALIKLLRPLPSISDPGKVITIILNEVHTVYELSITSQSEGCKIGRDGASKTLLESPRSIVLVIGYPQGKVDQLCEAGLVLRYSQAALLQRQKLYLSVLSNTLGKYFL